MEIPPDNKFIRNAAIMFCKQCSNYNTRLRTKLTEDKEKLYDELAY